MPEFVLKKLYTKKVVCAFFALPKGRFMGNNAEASFSGTEYDLITGKMTVYTDSSPIQSVQILKGSARGGLYTDICLRLRKHS